MSRVGAPTGLNTVMPSAPVSSQAAAVTAGVSPHSTSQQPARDCRFSAPLADRLRGGLSTAQPTETRSALTRVLVSCLLLLAAVARARQSQYLRFKRRNQTVFVHCEPQELLGAVKLRLASILGLDELDLRFYEFMSAERRAHVMSLLEEKVRDLAKAKKKPGQAKLNVEDEIKMIEVPPLPDDKKLWELSLENDAIVFFVYRTHPSQNTRTRPLSALCRYALSTQTLRNTQTHEIHTTRRVHPRGKGDAQSKIATRGRGLKRQKRRPQRTLQADRGPTRSHSILHVLSFVSTCFTCFLDTDWDEWEGSQFQKTRRGHRYRWHAC